MPDNAKETIMPSTSTPTGLLVIFSPAKHVHFSTSSPHKLTAAPQPSDAFPQTHRRSSFIKQKCHFSLRRLRYFIRRITARCFTQYHADKAHEEACRLHEDVQRMCEVEDRMTKERLWRGEWEEQKRMLRGMANAIFREVVDGE